MNTSIQRGAKCYGLYDEKNNIIGFHSVLPQPHGKIDKLRRVHRLVILPDYQGIGLGVKFATIVAKMYHDKGYRFDIKTSARNFIMVLQRHPNWKLYFQGRTKNGNKKSKIDCNRKSMRTKCSSCGFMYVE